MANKQQSEAGNHPLGSEFVLKLNAKAIASIETDFDRGIAEVGAELEKGSIRAVVSVLHHGTHPAITRDKAYELLDEHGIEGVQDIIGNAVASSGLLNSGGNTENPTEATVE